MINFAKNLNKMITAGLGGETEAPRTEVAVGHRTQYLDASGPVASFDTNIVAPLRKLLVTMLPIQAGSGDPSPDNIRPISGHDAVNIYLESEYDETANPAATIQLGQTVYSGTLDVSAGKMTVTKKSADLGALTWAYNHNAGVFYTLSIADIKTRLRYPPILTTIYKTVERAGATQVIDNFSIGVGTSAGVSNNTIIVKDERYSDPEEFATAITGQTILYDLVTPEVIDVSPQQITTLIGDNNVWSDAGDVDVTYIYYEETEGY